MTCIPKQELGNERMSSFGTLRLHESGTKLEAETIKVANLGPLTGKLTLRRKVLAGCELRRSLARGCCEKNAAALNFLRANSFQGQSRVSPREGAPFRGAKGDKWAVPAALSAELNLPQWEVSHQWNGRPRLRAARGLHCHGQSQDPLR